MNRYKKMSKIWLCIISIFLILGSSIAVYAEEDSIATDDAKDRIIVQTDDVPSNILVGAELRTNKMSYGTAESVNVALQNIGLKPIWVKNPRKEPWKIINVVTGKVIKLPDNPCPSSGYGYGYGGCGPTWNKLTTRQKILQTWNQRDEDGNLVPPGMYIAKARFTNQNPTIFSGPKMYTLYTVFVITGGNIKVVSPNGGENWKVGTTHEIKWKKTGNTGSSVKIELLKGRLARTIVSSTPNDGHQSWTIPSRIALGSDYKIRIKSNIGRTDTSDNFFTISNGKITVTSPNGGEVWKRGTTKTIKWTTSGFAGSKVKIELLKSGKVKQTIATSTKNDGSQTWTIPTWLRTGSDYKIRITSTSNSAYTDISNNNFRII